MNIELLQYNPDCEKIIASAAKLCYSSSKIVGILEDLNEEKTSKFIEKLMSMGHESPVEHIVFTFGIEGVSRSLTHQLVRHRIASYSQKSQRYVTEGQFEYIIPPEIDAIPEARRLFVETMNNDQKAYDALVDTLKDKHYNTFIAQGIDEKTAKNKAAKKAIEDARYVLPNACETKIIATFNARSLFNFFNHRCCERAQWEIREMACQMLNLVKQVAPTLFKYAGPSCLSGPCPEGRMSCGLANEKRKVFLGEQNEK